MNNGQNYPEDSYDGPRGPRVKEEKADAYAGYGGPDDGPNDKLQSMIDGPPQGIDDEEEGEAN